MDMIGRIRRLHRWGKKSVREIARMTGLSRNVIAKEAPIEVAPKYQRSEPPRISRRPVGLGQAVAA